MMNRVKRENLQFPRPSRHRFRPWECGVARRRRAASRPHFRAAQVGFALWIVCAGETAAQWLVASCWWFVDSSKVVA